MTPIDRS